MNVETREIRDEKDIPPEELLDGKWVRVAPKMAKKYEQKQPVTDDDYARIIAAEQRRKLRAAKHGGGQV